MLTDTQNLISLAARWIAGILIAGGGISAIALLTFKTFSEKWLNAKFEERLASYKHAQQRELEQLKFNINALMDRTVKLHQKEFDVLPEAWGRLIDAHGTTSGLIAAFQQYPDLDNIPLEQLTEFLEQSPLPKSFRDEVKCSGKKLDYYIKAITRHKINEAYKCYREFHVYFLKNGIFIPDEIKKKFTEMSGIIYGALLEHELNEDLQPRVRVAFQDLSGKGANLLKSLEQEVQGRLWKSEANRI